MRVDETGSLILTTPDWAPYLGNNHVQIPAPATKLGGAVSFKKHLGKPLGQALWTDLMHRLEIRGLCIYRPSQAQWTVGWGPGHCTLDLDEQGNVDNIRYVPCGRCTGKLAAGLIQEPSP